MKLTINDKDYTMTDCANNGSLASPQFVPTGEPDYTNAYIMYMF